MRALGLTLVLVAVGLAGCLADDPVEETDDFIPRVVVAVVDTGIMPYHDEFRQVRAGEDGLAHPSTYIPGYPADAAPLAITLDLERTDTEENFRADEQLWASTERDTLYYLPGTKIIGIIGIGGDLPGGGHGSMSSSRAGGNTISIPGDEVLLVHVRAPLALSADTDGEDANAAAVRWAGEQSWIDIQTNSWGMFVMCADKATGPFWGWAEAVKDSRDEHLVVFAAGNGQPNSGTPFPSQCSGTAGVAGVVTVGATDNDGYARWANHFPAVAADGCGNPAIDEATTDGIENTGGGTSSAAPFTAGGAAKVILEARRILRDPGVGIHDGVIATAHEGATVPQEGPLSDGTFTMDELKQVLFRTAISPPPVDDSDGDACTTTRVPIPPDAPPETTFPLIGYGEVNRDSIAHAIEVLTGAAPMPQRPNEDTLYEQDQDARRAMWG